MRAMLIGVLALAACGGENAPGGLTPAGDGTWVLHGADGCATGITLKGTDYSFQILCLLQGGGAGADVEMGSAVVLPDTIAFTPRAASCPDTDHTPWSLQYNLLDGGESLVVFSAAGLGTFKRVDTESAREKSGGGTVAFGCMYDDGFVPSPIKDL